MKVSRPVLGLLLVSLLAACSGSGDGASNGKGDGNGGDDGNGSGGHGGSAGDGGADNTHASCEVTGFEAASTDFTLPSMIGASSIAPFQTIGGGTYLDEAQTDYVAFTTTDLDGDGLPDLDVTSRTTDASIGKSAWKVYKGNGTGFEATATDFKLPSVTGASTIAPFQTFGGGTYLDEAQTDYLAFTTTDVTGDGLVDLVLTSRTTDASIGKSAWKVYKGSGSGFASSATGFTLPSLTGVSSIAPFQTIGGGTYLDDAQTDYLAFTTTDLDADGKVDLVVTSRSTDASIGKSAWKLYKGSGSGFAPSATDFALPSLDGASTIAPFQTIGGGTYLDDAQTDYLAFTTVDVDGDGTRDLVLTSRSTDASIGKSAWKVYKGSPSGFAAHSTDFGLPGVSGTTTIAPFQTFGGGTYLDEAQTDYVAFTALDVNGDHKLDLVLTSRSTDSSIGMNAWKVYDGACAAH